MGLVLAFAGTLLAGVLISALAERTVLSTAVLFLLVGLGLGHTAWATRALNPHLLGIVAELALFSVLFTDGMRAGYWPSAKGERRLVERALGAGMPLTILGIAGLAHWMLAMGWSSSILLGAVLSPTDPVFVSAIFAFDAVPERLRRLLNIESGLNDGLALPLVIIFLGRMQKQPPHFGSVLWELLGGIALGVAVPWIAIQLQRVRVFEPSRLFRPLNGFAMGLLVLALTAEIGVNMFLAAFAAGMTVAHFSPSIHKDFERFGELVAELLKLAAILVFGIAVGPGLWQNLDWRTILFIPLALFVVRLVAIEIAMSGSRLGRSERFAVGWFGPKGFASVVYGIMIFDLGTARALGMAHIVGVIVTVSILVYSSTDILVARHFL